MAGGVGVTTSMVAGATNSIETGQSRPSASGSWLAHKPGRKTAPASVLYLRQHGARIKMGR